MVSNEEGLITIPLAVIKAPNPTGMVFLDTSALDIFNQRKSDSSRPNRRDESLGNIETERRNQLNVFGKYSDDLGIQSIVIERNAVTALRGFILKL